jgi:ribosomal RNA-processing protein 9
LQSKIADGIMSGIEFMKANIENKLGCTVDDLSPETYAKAWLETNYVTYHRGHDLTPTCVALSQDGSMAFSGAKDGSVIQWDVEAGQKISYVLPPIKNSDVHSEESTLKNRNEREVLAVASSYDDRYLAVGGRDNCVRIFDIRTLGKSGSKHITKMEGHKKAVTSLSQSNVGSVFWK